MVMFSMILEFRDYSQGEAYLLERIDRGFRQVPDVNP
jgi:hypothetical protein